MMSKKWIFALTVMALLISLPCYAQEWAKTYGGLYWDYPYGGESIQRTIDGGYIVGSNTHSFGSGYDIWLFKLNSNGDVNWEKTYGGFYGDYFDSIQQTTDGGYIVSGSTLYSDDIDAESDLWVLRLDSDGDILWERTYDRSIADYNTSIRQTLDGEYILVGATYSTTSGYDIWVLKLNPDGHPDGDGSIAWEKVYGGDTGSEAPYSVHQSADGGYIVACGTSSFGAGNYDVWVLKLNPDGHPDGDGSIAWQNTYGGTGGDYIHSMQQTSDGGYIMAGNTWSFSGNDVWVLKLNPDGHPDGDGSIAWQKKYARSRVSEAYSIKETFNGLGYPNGYIVAAGTRSYSTGESLVAWILKLGLDGNVTWEKTYSGSDNDSFESIQQTTDGGYIVTGGTESFGAGYSDIWVLKLNENGEIPCCCAMIGESVAVVSTTSAVVGSSNVQPQISSAATGSLGITLQVTTAEISTICPGPDIEVTPLSHDFGDVLVGSSNTAIVTISNTGCTDLTVSDISFKEGSSGDYIITSSPQFPYVISPDGTVDIEITYSPTGYGLTAAILEISSDDPCDPLVEIQFRGNGMPVWCELVPDATIIPRGGVLRFQATATNNTNEVQVFKFATRITKPTGGKYPPTGYLKGPVTVNLGPLGSISRYLSHYIPNTAPLGTYIYHGYVGNYGVGLYDECTFDFEVIP